MKRVLILSLTLNLVLVVTIVLGGSFTGRIVQTNVLDPIYERAVSLFASYPVQRGDVVFIGDTLVAGGNFDEMFPALPVRNRGVVGDSTAGILARLDQVSAAEPAAVVIMAGTFDVLAGVPRSTTVANLEAILDHLAEETPATRVIVNSVLPRDAEALLSVRRLNTDYAELAERRGALFLDLTPDFADDAGLLDDKYSNDGLHLNGPGYALWQARLAPLLADLVDGAAATNDAAAADGDA
ncbi:MAG TPA: GDSL-type esterase/lipase family protein [Pseudomonadales bacterium]|nr:GDSL-type esterase/lipase family protein [Pseudomonadales bacterium]